MSNILWEAMDALLNMKRHLTFVLSIRHGQLHGYEIAAVCTTAAQKHKGGRFMSEVPKGAVLHDVAISLI